MGYHGGLRAWKEDSSGNRTYFLYDGINIVCELNESGAVDATNTFGANGLIARNDGEESVFYTFDDGGNVIQLIDDTGTVITTEQYDAYGNRIAGTNDTPYGYQGQYGYYTDSETGLILATNRYYDPTEGRWLTRDPIGYAGGLNLYGYCGNNPVNYSDPLGLCEDGNPWMGYIHTGLDVIGLIPGIGEIADGANALLYLYEGDYFNAAISGVSALGGDGAKLLRGGSNLVGGAGFVVKHGDEAGDAGKGVVKGFDRPSRYRKGTLERAWDEAADGPTGGKLCPTCSDEVHVPPGQGRPRDWDADHQPPISKRNWGDMTRPEQLDDYNNGVRLECPHCNRSRGTR